MQTAASKMKPPIVTSAKRPSKEEEEERRFSRVVPFEAPEPRRMAGRPVD